ncbi:XdhC family protein [Alicyclobacillus fastidiosus]|uniref:XdhC family protein n=1 Tax=Alicyclobacillus fastidiosus TaxID=392011 RepID=A0ABV5ABT0_9BACL|nr:XdhC/CoxI family protein [Alicyclobacillus fastidiosus]WEH10324.1 XdhC family protein [Alicyclobacillus fastidiosus]
MTTIHDFTAALEYCADHAMRAAVAVVVETDGSVYRRAGARSVITEAGQILGVISGGCAEQDLLEHAKETWQTGQTLQTQYDFRSPDDLLWGMGAGCNGALTVCLIPFDPLTDPDLAHRLQDDLRRRADASDSYVAVTVLQSSDRNAWPIGPVPATVVSNLRDLPEVSATAPSLIRRTWDGTDVQLFVEVVSPRPRLVVFGAGDDARPLVRFAAAADWHVTVVDHRAESASPTRFPEAAALRVIRRDEYLSFDVDEAAFAVVMTHNYQLDRDVLQNLLPRSLDYLGVLGPRRRFDGLVQEVRAVGVELDAAYMAKVHSPVGLDIGAQTPEEIALSVIAEAIACRRSRTGGSLREGVGAFDAKGAPT